MTQQFEDEKDGPITVRDNHVEGEVEDNDITNYYTGDSTYNRVANKNQNQNPNINNIIEQNIVIVNDMSVSSESDYSEKIRETEEHDSQGERHNSQLDISANLPFNQDLPSARPSPNSNEQDGS